MAWKPQNPDQNGWLIFVFFLFFLKKKKKKGEEEEENIGEQALFVLKRILVLGLSKGSTL